MSWSCRRPRCQQLAQLDRQRSHLFGALPCSTNSSAPASRNLHNLAAHCAALPIVGSLLVPELRQGPTNVDELRTRECLVGKLAAESRNLRMCAHALQRLASSH